jgi:thiosulfate dehydrogenase [quinone] large subunit
MTLAFRRWGLEMKTPDSASVPGMRWPERGLAVLRILVGLWFVKSFATKLGLVWLGGVIPVPAANDRWITTMPKLLAKYAEGNPIGVYQQFLLDTVLPHGSLFAHLTAVAETAVGIGLTFGLLTVLASLIGMTLVTAYGLANFWQGPSQQGFHLLLFACLAVFIAVRAGRCWGLDGWLLGRALRRMPAASPARLLFGAYALAAISATGAPPLRAQPAAALPVMVIADFTFEGRSANSVEPGDSAIAPVATARLRDVLRSAGVVTLVDSSRAAQEIARANRQGIRCAASVECMRAVGQRLGATYVVVGKVSKVSGLIWYLSGQLLSVAGGAPLLDEGFELKGARDDIVPRGAASLGRRIARAVSRASGG